MRLINSYGEISQDSPNDKMCSIFRSQIGIRYPVESMRRRVKTLLLIASATSGCFSQSPIFLSGNTIAKKRAVSSISTSTRSLFNPKTSTPKLFNPKKSVRFSHQGTNRYHILPNHVLTSLKSYLNRGQLRVHGKIEVPQCGDRVDLVRLQ